MARHRVLFACVHNAGRSQMAAALFNALADPAKAEASSAGTRPASELNADVRTVMKEIGIDLTAARPRLLTDDLARAADMLITMGCGEACPSVAGIERDDWALPDPAGRSLAEVRAIRDDVAARVRSLLAARGWARQS